MLAFGGVFALGQSQCLRGRDSRKEEDHLPKLASRMKAAFPRDPRPSSLVPRPSSLVTRSRIASESQVFASCGESNLPRRLLGRAETYLGDLEKSAISPCATLPARLC